MRKSRCWEAFCRVRVAERAEAVAVVTETEICGIEEAAMVPFSRSDFSVLGSIPGRSDRVPSPGQRACFMLCIKVIMVLVVER